MKLLVVLTIFAFVSFNQANAKVVYQCFYEKGSMTLPLGSATTLTNELEYMDIVPQIEGELPSAVFMGLVDKDTVVLQIQEDTVITSVKFKIGEEVNYSSNSGVRVNNGKFYADAPPFTREVNINCEQVK